MPDFDTLPMPTTDGSCPWCGHTRLRDVVLHFEDVADDGVLLPQNCPACRRPLEIRIETRLIISPRAPN